MCELVIKNGDELVPGDLIIPVAHHFSPRLVIAVSEKIKKNPYIRMYYTYDGILDSHLVHISLKFHVLV